MNILLGSKSAHKLAAAQNVVKKFIDHDVEVETFNAKSNVPAAPWDEDTLMGARLRAKECHEKATADICVGLESGLTKRGGVFFEETWAIVITRDGKEYLGYSSGLAIPDYVIRVMKEQNLTHDKAMEYIDLTMDNLDAAVHHDTWHTYTGGQIVRQVSLEEALRNALVQSVALNSSLYAK